ncbi:MAG: GGDEF domain-containing protein [Planctomycetota bacterium]|nr:MAG: GGDEF domain-containing protein [Planctomycetota bacterium]
MHRHIKMYKISSKSIAALFGLPLLAILSTTFYQISNTTPTYPYPWLPLLGSLLSLLAVFSFWQAGYILHLKKEIQTLQNLHQQQQKQIDFLSALREMSLAINEQIHLKDLLHTVLDMVDTALNPQEILILIQDEETENLQPAVYKQKENILFFQQIQNLPTHFQNIPKQNQQQILNASLIQTQILATEKEILGLLCIQWDLQHAPPKENLEPTLQVLAKHISLAIRKPTLYDKAVIDSLTGLYTKRHFLQQIKKLFSLSQRLQQPFSLILIDIDHFKSINDRHGHLSGDIVLAKVSQCLRQSIREYDTAYRYGGEELAILLPQTEKKEAAKIAERLRQNIAQLRILGEKKQPIPVTCSAGVASYQTTMNTFYDLISLADQYLYQAKNSGRNQVCSA